MLVLTWHSEPGLPAELHISNIGGNAVKNPTVFCSQSCNLEDPLGKQRVPAAGGKAESEPSKAGHDMQGRKVGSLFSSSDASLGKDGFKVAVSYLPCGKLWKCVLMWAQLMCYLPSAEAQWLWANNRRSACSALPAPCPTQDSNPCNLKTSNAWKRVFKTDTVRAYI